MQKVLQKNREVTADTNKNEDTFQINSSIVFKLLDDTLNF